jgi:dihydrofolate reductase
MRKLLSFMVVTLDGYYEGPNGEFDWPNVEAAFNEFSISQLNDIDTLLFGRVTYEGMASYWPTPVALKTAVNDADGRRAAISRARSSLSTSSR